MIRFVHAADLHLDSPFRGLKELHPELFEQIYQSTFQSLQQIITMTIEQEVDFLLISGDIYDEENQSVKAQAFFRDQMKRLEEAGIPVFLLHGNHDFMGRESLRIQMPANVTIFGTTPETHLLKTASNESVAISGFSYPTRWVTERMIQQYPKRHPKVDFHLGMLHGYLEGSEAKEGVYAPFSINDLLETRYDYWALGHIHKRAVLHAEPLVIYPGNTQGRNPNELGEKGSYLVTLQKGSNSQATFMPSAAIEWVEKTVSLTGINSLSGLYGVMEKEMEEMEAAADSKKRILLSLQLTDLDGLNKDVLSRIEDGDLLEGMNQAKQHPFVYLYRLGILPRKERLLFTYDEKMQASFERSRKEMNEKDHFRKVLQDFFKNQTVRSRFSELEQDESLREEILLAAEQLLRDDIVFEEGEESVED